jgi:hypothetical protein
MSIFKDKNIKYNKNCNNEKKSIHYNIIDVKHIEKMDNIKKKEDNLPNLKDECDKIISELKKICDENTLDSYIEEIKSKRLKILSKIETIKNTSDKKINLEEKNKISKRAVKHMIVNVNEVQLSPKEKQIAKQEKQIVNYDEQLSMLTNIYERNCHINNLKHRKADLEEEIYNIDNNLEELDYFDGTYDILHDYYKKDEDDKRYIKVDNICDLFKDDVISKQETSYKKTQIVDKFLQSINQNKKKKKSNIGKICEICKIPKSLNIQEGIFTCKQCGECELAIMDSDKPSYRDPTSDIKSNTYRRANHCSELLNQSQGKESTEIEESLFNDIINGLYSIGITDLACITKTDIKIVLTNLGKTNKVEHAVYIINKINGIPAETMSHELNEIVKQMFAMVEEAWYLYKEPNRKNFMNTKYVFHKIFELLGEDDEAKKWSLLADAKLCLHDDLWEKICVHWQWEYIPTI